MFLPNVPGATFIPGATSIPESRVAPYIEIKLLSSSGFGWFWMDQILSQAQWFSKKREFTILLRQDVNKEFLAAI